MISFDFQMEMNKHMDFHDRFAPLEEDDAKRISRLFTIFEAFREVAPTIPASYAQAFLAIALKPGQPAGSYGLSLGLDQPVVSRILLEIGKKSRNSSKKGLDLVNSQGIFSGNQTLIYGVMPDVIVMTAIMAWVISSRSNSSLWTLIVLQSLMIAINGYTVATAPVLKFAMVSHIVLRLASIGFALKFMRKNSFKAGRGALA